MLTSDRLFFCAMTHMYMKSHMKDKRLDGVFDYYDDDGGDDAAVCYSVGTAC